MGPVKLVRGYTMKPCSRSFPYYATIMIEEKHVEKGTTVRKRYSRRIADEKNDDGVHEKECEINDFRAFA